MVRWSWLVAAAWLALGSPLGNAQSPAPALAKPVDPIIGILKAFETHDVVALGEGNHNNLQGAAFREKLYRDPRIQKLVRDIVVESGNSRYQATMDRYIAGGDVPEKELRKAWLETTQANTVWDALIYAKMFQTIRDINRSLPKGRKLRVLLGDDPYPAPDGKFHRTEGFAADLTRAEALARHHKALIVYGDMHYLRHHSLDPAGSIVGQLEKSGAKVFSVWSFTPLGDDLTTLQPDVASWPKPSLTLIKGTTLGLAPFTFYYPKGFGTTVQNGVRTDLGESIGGVMQDQFDTVLYLGPKSEITYDTLPRSLCADPEYVAMRAARLSDRTMADGSSAGDEFKARCAAVVAGH